MLRNAETKRGPKARSFTEDDLQLIDRLLHEGKTNAQICAVVQGGIPKRTFLHRLKAADKCILENRFLGDATQQTHKAPATDAVESECQQ